MWPFHRRPLAVILPVSLWGERAGWVIQWRELPHGWGEPRDDWEMCPGTLYEMYPTPEEARIAAGWWGFRV